MAYTTIDNPELYFQTKLYTGNGSTNAITLDGDEDMSPNVVWIKERSETGEHALFDTVRGVNNFLQPSNNNADNTSRSDVLTAFGSDGFTLGADGDDYAINQNTNTYVAWCWKESATAGFDIVAYTGTGSARTISHSLSAVPHFILQKERNEASNWKVYHHKNTSAPETDYLTFNSTAATDDYADYWNDTAPTSSVYTVGSAADINGSSDTYVTYLWTGIQGFSKFGSYTGNGNVDGTFVYTGFKPSFVICKKSNNTEDWGIWGFYPAYNVIDRFLYGNASNAEYTSISPGDFLSNGFKLRTSDGKFNNSGDTYIYMAFAEAPFVNSNGVPCNAR